MLARGVDADEAAKTLQKQQFDKRHQIPPVEEPYQVEHQFKLDIFLNRIKMYMMKMRITNIMVADLLPVGYKIVSSVINSAFLIMGTF